MKFALPILFFCILGQPTRGRSQDLIIHFAHNSARISQAEELRQLNLLREQHRQEVGTWFVEGRTSSSGSTAYNDSLSMSRAEAVRKLLYIPDSPLQTFRLSAMGENLATPGTDAAEDRVVIVRFTPTPPAPEKIRTYPPSQPFVHITVLDAVTRKPIAGSGSYLGQPSPFSVEGLSVPVPPVGGLDVHFSATGYRDSTFYIPSAPSQQTVELLPEGVLEKLVFQNIYFYPNTPDIVPESYRAMEQMLKQLQTRPGVNIQIRGHVNWPEPYPITPQIDQELQELSEKRAKAVMDWLIKKGIPATHLSAVGLGHSQMLFPKANTEGQQAQNRRVEVLLLK